MPNPRKNSDLGKERTKGEVCLSSSPGKESLDEETEELEMDAAELLEKGNLEETESSFEEALKLFQQALTIYQRIHHTKGIIQAHQNLLEN